MIPPFDVDGFLLPGIHPATLDEIRDRFGGSSEIRRVQMESIAWMPFLSIALLSQSRFDELVTFFETDRSGRRKGMIEVI